MPHEPRHVHRCIQQLPELQHPDDAGLTDQLPGQTEDERIQLYARQAHRDACRNLGKLSAKLRWRSTYGADPISHDLLRKWSSCKRTVMPAAALGPVLGAVRVRSRAEALTSGFYAARLFTFLCVLLRAGTRGPKLSWHDVQAQLRSRYLQVYRLQAAQPLVMATGMPS